MKYTVEIEGQFDPAEIGRIFNDIAHRILAKQKLFEGGFLWDELLKVTGKLEHDKTD
jgi:hypothetical protein